MNNLPPGVTVNQIPGWREEDVQRHGARKSNRRSYKT